MASVASHTITLMSVRFSSSYAAVKPAGPAPAMIAIFGIELAKSLSILAGAAQHAYA